MLATSIHQVMELAVYEIIADDKLYWGEIPGLQGVWRAVLQDDTPAREALLKLIE